MAADKAYSARVNLAAVTHFGGMPYIPLRVNVQIRTPEATLWDQMYHFYHLHRETFLQHSTAAQWSSPPSP